MRISALLTVPGSLAAAAVLSLSGPTYAAAAACGTQAQPAVYEAVVHPDVYETVPAVTHTEWQWTRQVPTTEREITRTLQPGHEVIRWTRVTRLMEHAYSRTVIDQAYVPATPGTPEVGHWETVVVTPAVTMTLWEYLQLQTGNTRWEEEGWNAGPGGRGWSPTGNTDDVIVIPAVTEQRWVVDQPAVPGTPEIPELSHVETVWVADGDSAPAGYAATGASRVASTSTETVDLPEGETPDGEGWEPGDVVEVVDPVTESDWIAEDVATPAGWSETGATRSGAPATETTDATSADAPSGDGWTPVPGSEVTVVDVPEKDVLVSAAWVEQVLVTPATEAGPACPVEDDGTDDETSGAAEDGDDVSTPQAGQAVDDPVLPNAGGPNGWVFFGGLGAILAGVALTRRPRRQPARERRH